MIHVIREQHEPSPAVARRLEIAGGVNRFGRPNYRAVWGWSRLGWIGGKWEDRGAGGELVAGAKKRSIAPTIAAAAFARQSADLMLATSSAFDR